RSRDEFVATVSHELRTPLNSILGWTQILRTARFNATQVDHALESVERAAKAQVQLVEDLLDISRAITGKLVLNIRPVDLKKVIESSIEAIRPAADAKAIRLEVNLLTRGGWVTGDASRLQQIVWNLLSNAVKFTPVNGRVEITTERTDVQMQIIVSDSGDGIRSEFLPYVFDRFSQARATSERQSGGLGLGLAIV